MSELLERLCQIERRDKALGQSLRAFLEAIAEMHARDKAEIERLRPLAEKWQLVLEMRDSTRLVRGTLGYYLTMERIEATLGGGLWTWLPGCSTDPAEALRSIQASE
jgi:hypothetical protein